MFRKAGQKERIAPGAFRRASSPLFRAWPTWWLKERKMWYKLGYASVGGYVMVEEEIKERLT